ncbi:hypothetical protein HC891_24710 [Candidatus Gracilibacteria bacterium]|nr:hypothetical protein [Candidatus Gracilibacteria bacterium]
MQRSTERLILRPLVLEDWLDVHTYQDDERYLRFNAGEGRTPEQVQDFIRALTSSCGHPPYRFFLRLCCAVSSVG